MHKPTIAALAFVTFLTTENVQAQEDHARAPETRLLVVAFENASGQAGQNYLSVGLAAFLAEQLELEKELRLQNGPLVLTSGQARLFAGGSAAEDRQALIALAAAVGATHVVTGQFSGKPWDWKILIRVSVLENGELATIGEGRSQGDQMAALKRANGTAVKIISAANIHKMLAAAAAQAFAEADLELSPVTIAAIETPATNDAYAFQILARAYDRYFETGRVRTEKTALEIAEHAVLIDPANPAAQRFYAFLLDEQGQPKKARIHYEQALAKAPGDIRSIIALGRIELNQRNFTEAAGLFRSAAARAPDDPRGHHWLGKSLLELGESAAALAEFERARELDGHDLATRRELAGLYAAAGRHGEAAGEWREIAAGEPDNLEPLFHLAANLRAADRVKEAIETYLAASVRFASETRLHRYRGDLLAAAGDAEGADQAYQAAARIAGTAKPAPACRSTIGQLTGKIGLGRTLAAALEEHRRCFKDAANDALIDLAWNGKTACASAPGPSAAAALAAQNGDSYLKVGQELRNIAADLDCALKDGDGSALTSDETAAAVSLITQAGRAESDLAEMRAEFRSSLLPQLKRFGCTTDLAAIQPADIGELRRCGATRRVELPEIQPPRWSMPFSPQVPPDSARTVTFAVDNRGTASNYQLVIDGSPAGQIPAGQMIRFTAKIGRHQICLVTDAGSCADAGNRRMVFIHDNWTIVVKAIK